MGKFKYLAALVVLTGGMVSTAFAQGGLGWYQQCFFFDPDDEDGPDNDHYTNFGVQTIATELIGAAMGVTGTVQYGSADGPCYIPGITYDASGRMAFFVGLNGSIQSSFDDGLALTMGAPVDPAGDFSYMIILKDDNEPGNGSLFGDGGLHTAWIGASRRYMVHGWTDGDVNVIRTTRLIGDAVRLQWDIQNLGDEARPLGMMFATAVAMQTSFGRFDSQDGTTQAHTLLGTNFGIAKLTPDNYIGWSLFPNGKPFRLEHRYASNSPRFPTDVRFLFGQTEAYGLLIDNIPSPDYARDNMAATVDLFLVGNYGVGVSPGLIWNNVIRTHVFTDPPGGTSETGDIFIVATAFVQRFPVRTVAAGAILQMSHYIRSAWSVSSYFDPYTALIDAPKILNSDPTGQDGLSPNPFTIRAYVDNQYADVDLEINMQDVTFTIILGEGFSLVAGEPQQITLNRIDANDMGFVEWQVESDGVTFGSIPVTVTFQPLPGPAKQLTAHVLVAATPRIRMPEQASMITFPYQFPDTSFGSILGLQQGVDFVAFRWDTAQATYLPASSAQRGEGYWIIPSADQGYIDLQNATRPGDTTTGGLLYSLGQGWNMIGNPYNYPIPLSHLIAVAEDNPAQVFTWSELVNNGFVSSALAHWDRGVGGDGNGSYRWTVSQTDVLEPHKAYWIFVTVFQPIRLSWPAVLMPGLGNAGRAEYEKPWNKTDKQWRLQLTARTQDGSDTENWIGVVSDPKLRDILQLPKPPFLEEFAAVDLAIKGEYRGTETRLAQALSSSGGKVTWEVFVTTQTAGDVTITWPNLPSIPRGIRAKLTDLATNERRDLRAVSSYSYYMSEPGTRAFTLTLEPGGSSRPVIGNVIVSQPNLSSRGAPMTISYALSADALVSVRILSATGKEIYTITRGRADDAGENTVTWALRDNANRAVPPGTYRVEILAETPNGERVRKIIPINVIR